MKNRIIAVIPARGGSKSIPLKNIKTFAGKPLIAWSILAAKGSKHINRVFVSTDHPQIAKIARQYGAEVIDRPAEFAQDRTPTEPVVKHAYEWLRDHKGYAADTIVLLQPTTPSRQSFHIDQGIEWFRKTKADSVVAVNETPAHHTPYWTWVRSKSGRVTLFGGGSIKDMLPQRQAFPQKCYGRNDLFFIIKPSNLLQKKMNLYGDRVELLETGTEYEMDINTLQEWHDAEIKFKRLLRASKGR